MQPRRNVDPVSIHRTVGLLDHLTKVNADAKAHAPIFRDCVSGRPELVLRGKRGAHRSGCGLEHGKNRVARHVHHPPLPRLDVLSEHGSRSVERSHRGKFVRGHQA